MMKIFVALMVLVGSQAYASDEATVETTDYGDHHEQIVFRGNADSADVAKLKCASETCIIVITDDWMASHAGDHERQFTPGLVFPSVVALEFSQQDIACGLSRVIYDPQVGQQLWIRPNTLGLKTGETRYCQLRIKYPTALAPEMKIKFGFDKASVE
jgi:hypothetical protein